MEHKIDIIIPAYNAHNWIGNMLKCISRQTFKDNILVTIVDDGSKITYDKLIKELALPLNINIVRTNRNYGLIKARELGIKNTNREYIMFLDSDDIIVNDNMIKQMYDMMDLHNYKVVYARELNANKKIYHDFHISGKLLRRSVIVNNNIKSHKYTMEEDVSFMMSYYSVIKKEEIYKIDKLFYKYKTDTNSNSITSKYAKFVNYDYTTLFSAINHGYKYAKKYNNYWFYKDNMIKVFIFLAREYKKYVDENNTDDFVKNSFLKKSNKFYNKYKDYIEGHLKYNRIDTEVLELYDWFKNKVINC